MIWQLSVIQGREPCDPSHFYREVAGGSFHRQFLKCTPKCVALHHNDCILYVASQVGLFDTVRAKVRGQWTQQNTQTDVYLMVLLNFSGGFFYFFYVFHDY